MVREMVGGCCVCLDERGWNENPLVYCDGSGCNVAVHQACYGIVKVPSGPWFCCKCRSQERIARVKCELCPLKDGALKRTDTGGWAHVVCALYIPEVRFGNVSTMEPITFSSVPHERFLKACYICEENGKESKTSSGACMNCHKAGCKLSFHVTCAQSKRQLCEEASINGHVQYVGYCAAHWTKRFKQPGTTSSVNENDIKKFVAKEKKPRSRSDSTSSTNSVDNIPVKSNRGRKPKHIEVSNDAKTHVNNISTNHRYNALSPVEGDEATLENPLKISSKAAIPNGQASSKEVVSHSFSVNGLLGNEKTKLNSPLNTPVSMSQSTQPPNKEDSFDISLTDHTETDEKLDKVESKKRKSMDKEKLKKKVKFDKPKEINNNKEKEGKDREKKKKDKTHLEDKKQKNKDKNNDKKRKYPQPSQIGMLENGKVSSWDSVIPKMNETPDNFQEFLEHQWNESAQFLVSKAEHFDVSSLLNCLHQLKADNMKLEKKLLSLKSRRDRLLGVNARLAASITNTKQLEKSEKSSPLSEMLSKLNDDSTSSFKPKKSKKSKDYSKDLKSPEEKGHVASPDLAMLAAASAKLESSRHNNHIKDSTRMNEVHGSTPPDEKPPVARMRYDSPRLIQPNVGPQPPSIFTSELLKSQVDHHHYRKDYYGESSTSDHKNHR